MADEDDDIGNRAEDDALPQLSKEDRAKARGWSPKEKWRGHPDDWVDADRFLEIAETSLPFVKAENKRLLSQQQEMQGRFQSMQAEFDRRLRASEAANKKTLEIQKRNLLQQFDDEKRAALEIQDPEIRRQAYDGAIRRERTAFQDVIREERQIEEQFAPPPQQQGPQVPEEVQQWGKRNPWVNYVPQEMRIEAVEVMQQLDASSPEMSTTEKLDTVTSVMRRRHPQWFPPAQVQSGGEGENEERSRNVGARRPVSAVEGGGGLSTGRTQPKGKSFNDLPREAKSAFNELMREGRLGRPRAGDDEAKFRDAMQKEYASTYWTEYGE